MYIHYNIVVEFNGLIYIDGHSHNSMNTIFFLNTKATPIYIALVLYIAPLLTLKYKAIKLSTQTLP